MRLKNCDTQKEYEIDDVTYKNELTETWCGICKCNDGEFFAKILNYGNLGDFKIREEMLSVFVEEVNTLKKVMKCSQKVPRLRDSWDDKRQKQYFIIMDKMPGTSLRLWMDSHKREKLNAKDVFVRVKLVQQICEIMRDISRRCPSIVHRDLKPENIYIDFDSKTKRWEIYIIDFGCANLNRLRGVGTKHYQAPEQSKKQNLSVAISMKTDLFAIGQIMFELLTGRVPDVGIDYTYKLGDEQWKTAPTIPDYLWDIKGMELIDSILKKMTRLKPEDRPTYDRIITELKNIRIG